MWFPLSVFLYATFAAAVAETSPLLPFKTPASVYARSTWKRNLAPKDVVSLSYAPAASHSPRSSLTFTANPEVPILLLEDIDFLVQTVECHYSTEPDDSVVEITFTSEDAYDATLAAWSSLSKFMLVTSHQSCNPHDQRGAWLVSAAVGRPMEHSIVLQVQQVPLREIGWTFHISHAADGISGWESPRAGGLYGRDIDKIFTLEPSVNFDQRQQLFPTDPNNTAISLLESKIPNSAGLHVFCTDCVSTTNLSIGIEIDVELLDITQAYINITVNDFQQDINLEFSFNDTASYHSTFDALVIPFPGLGISIADVVTVGFNFGGSVRMDLETSAALNFTVGASASIPSGAIGTLNMLHNNESSASGWDQATFDVHPFRVNGGTFSVTGDLSFSPFLEATLQVGDTLSPTARVYINAPSVHAAANISKNVNRQCEAVGPNDFEFFDSALTFGASLNVSVEGTLSGAPFDDHDMIFYSKALSFGNFPSLTAPLCMVIVDDDASATSTSSLAGQVIAPTGTLLAAAAAIPSFNVAGIQSYYSANGALPTGVNYTQMAEATTVPDDIKKAVQKKAGALGRHATTSLVSIAVSVVFGGFLGSLL
ncbi:hypothetical protein GGX14DRAFT_459016 [Mycena pura]|uniref:Uncharacterized protein n=1 Tax=Mycena pura TaxID=153505 RepID=A0AAD6V872_9AGAR|nr:hypothetical protein GGX14DRAFT_459016 [Mycena pura]